MITYWALTNFKPIGPKVSLHTKPLTILAGLNSSGKSSVIQSILMLSQTTANPNPEKPLVLNGNLIQLGTFDSTKHEQSDIDQVTIEYALDLDPHIVSTRRRSRSLGRYDFEEQIRDISGDLSFRAAAAKGSVPSGIEAVKVALARSKTSATWSFVAGDPSPSPEPTKIRTLSAVANLRPMSPEEETSIISGVKEEYLKVIPYPKGDNYAAELTLTEGDEEVSTGLALAGVTHFLPSRFIRKFEVGERQRQRVAAAINYVFGDSDPWEFGVPSFLRDIITQLGSMPVAEMLLQQVTTLTNKQKKKLAPFFGDTYMDLIQWGRGAPLMGRAKNNFTVELRSLIETYVFGTLYGTELKDPSYGLEFVSDTPAAMAIDIAAQRVAYFFSSMIRYLGPIRADPQSAQGFAPSSEPDDVGIKGEYAAAVYDANRRQPVEWLDPNTDTVISDSLEKAVDFWAAFLGVAHHVSTREAGLSGVSWMVQQLPETKNRPLSAVGVGVSQVLPILVAGLLAPKGAVILLEQPELHLHARAQARLGDFFLSLARSGKQCIIETHSDCLVNQVRYRMVRAGQAVRDATAIYFAEQNSKGVTSMYPVKISRTGSIENWPPGFFDENLRQEDLITRASITARQESKQ